MKIGRHFIVVLAVAMLLFCSFQFQNPTFNHRTKAFNDSIFCFLESQQAVFNQDIVRNELYTWTSKEQINLLRNSSNLLLKSESATKGKANYDLVLDSLKNSGNQIAAFLLSPSFAKKRFAWPQPWATVRGYPNENYGDQLLRITFKEDAIFGSFIPAEGDTLFHFYSMKGKKLDPDFVMAHPERLAVVYFVNSKITRKTEAHYRGTYSRHYDKRTITAPFPYREYVICNESMIREWSYGTVAIKNKIKDNLAYLNYLREAIHTPLDKDNSGCAPVAKYDRYIERNTQDEWNNTGYNKECCNYLKTLALINKYYDLSDQQLKKTIHSLNAALLAQVDSIVIKK